MSTSYKNFSENDHTRVKSLLHEGVPITGTYITSGTYTDENIKTFSHGMFQKVYDYPYLSSSASPMFDITFGYAGTSDLSASTNEQNSKKIAIYNQMAQVLFGHDSTGQILEFDQDGNITEGGTKLKECFFFSFDRSLYKDEIKKDSFRFTFGTGAYGDYFSSDDLDLVFGDYGASSAYKVNSPVGEYGIIYTSSATPNSESGFGLIFYQAGLLVLSGSVSHYINDGDGMEFSSSGGPLEFMATGNTIDNIANEMRERIRDITFSNTTEVQSSIYFVRLNHNEFNYSSNPTYLSNSKIVVKSRSEDLPVAYITGIGLYSPDGELLAVAKLSEPYKKSADTEAIFRTRISY